MQDNLSKTSKFFIKTYGCQYNEWDAARLAFALSKVGLSEAAETDADVIFVLNCSVRKTAVDRALGKMKNWQDKKIILTGCILKNDMPRFANKKAHIWDGNDIERLRSILDLKVTDHEFELFLSLGQKKTNCIPIMKGCNNFCAYCAVPYTRGREISRSIEEILEDVKKTVRAGNTKIWLLGQNVNSYTDSRKNNFAALLTQVNNIPGDFTIYFTSNHPKDMTDEIINAIADLPKVAKLIHLPIQSGSDKILKAMNRPYTKKQYLDLVDKIKKRIPSVQLTTDSIIGFPGESAEDFQETVEVFKKVNFSQAFNNKYSPREGTAAWNLGDPIPWEEKQRRWQVLNDLTNKG